MSVLDKMKKIKNLPIVDFVNEPIKTGLPLLNIAYGGSVQHGGLEAGITVLAGASKTYKTLLGWYNVAAFLKDNPDGLCVFWDSEFGSKEDYMETMGVNPDQVLHLGLERIEDFKIDLVQRLQELDREDKVIFFVDSLDIASVKEHDDALKGDVKQDMTRAKTMKSVFRLIRTTLNLKNIPMVCIAHTYKEQGSMYPKDIIAGGEGVIYGADQAFILTKRKEKEGTELVGFTFTLNVEKSRAIKEGSKLPLTVNFDNGIDYTSGIFELAEEGGFIKKISPQKYSYDGEEFKKKEAEPHILKVLEDPEFDLFLQKKYLLKKNKKEENDGN